MKIKANKTIKSGIEEINNKIEDRTTFFYYAFRNILLVGLPLVLVSAFLLSLPHSSARVSSNDSLSISVPSSCTLSSSVDEAHSASIVNGTYEEDIGKTTLTTFCNDRNGYSVYAIGDSLNSEGNNKLVSSLDSSRDINTGLLTSGDTSQWAMKLTLKANDDSPTPPTIESTYNNTYGLIPSTWTKVATISAGTTDMKKGSSFVTTYSTYISPTQPADTYIGQVKYLLTHPSSASVSGVYIMQNVAEWEDEIPNSGDSVQAIDIRDNKTYWVTRLADGHIWITQNLDFDIAANTRLSSETTDLNEYNADPAEGPYYYGYSKVGDIIYWEPASTATTINFTGTTVTGWQSSNTEPYSASKTGDTNTGHASLGNYYNWTAAIASNNSNNLTSDTISNINNNPKNSICPKGWRLPTISSESGSIPNSTNEFARLNYLYNNDSTNTASGLFANPLFFVMAGEIDSGNYTTSQLRYVSSTVKNQNNNYFLQYKPNDSVPINLSASWTKSSGRSIRCLAR